MKTQSKYGLQIDLLKATDYIFGSSPIPYEELVPDGNWEQWLPVKEFQNLNAIEPYACVPFTVLNCIETLIKRKYGIEKNYSDRFLSALVDTRNGGTSPQKCCDYLRNQGVVPQEVWPFDEKIDTSEKFFADIPQAIKDIAKEFLNEFEFCYERVSSNPRAIMLALNCSPLFFSVAAWFKKNGFYYKPQGMTDNHATTLFYAREGAFWRMFDSYDKPHIKDYQWGDLPQICMRFWIEKKNPRIAEIRKTLLDIIFETLKRIGELLGLLKVEVKKLEPVNAEERLKETTPMELLKQYCLESVGQDISPLDEASDDRACAESLSGLLRRVFPNFPVILSTEELDHFLTRDKHFKSGDAADWSIINSPTGSGNGSVSNGHCGVLGESGIIYSNNSRTGKWDSHWTLGEWIAYYRDKGGFKLYFYSLK